MCSTSEDALHLRKSILFESLLETFPTREYRVVCTIGGQVNLLLPYTTDNLFRSTITAIMFRKLQDRVAAVASAAFGTADSDVQRLQSLGNFTTEQVTSALRATSGNVDRAADLLLSQQQQQQQQQHNQFSTASNQNVMDLTGEDDDDLQQALQQSLQEVRRPTRTPAMNDAAQAAERRAAANKNKPLKAKPSNATGNAKPKAKAQSALSLQTNTPYQPSPPVIRNNVHSLKKHHPDVKLIPKLQDKSVEEQILRTADRMKNNPAAVDTLHRAMTALFRDPDQAKYRRIDTSTAGFVRSVAPAPGAVDFLKALKFAQQGQFLVLHEPLYDPALMYLGLTALEQTRDTIEYRTAKELLVFTKEMTRLLETTPSATETTQRSAHLAKCPTEPAPGRGALLQVQLLVEQSNGSSAGSSGTSRTIRRRFDSDDTVADVLSWIGGTVGTDILAHLVNETWCLANVNHSQRAPIHVATQKHWTLQSVGCWPSGRLQVQPMAAVAPTAAESSSTGAWVLRAGESHGLASGTSSDDE
jgi:UBA/TS-N domain/PUB domain